MNNDDFIEQICDKFSVIYYYIKLNKKRDNIVIREDTEWDQQKLNKDTGVKGDFTYREDDKEGATLDIIHASTLWLIDELLKRKGICLQVDLHRLLAWKFPTDKNTPTKVIYRLLAVGYVKKGKSKIGGTKNVIEITSLGENFLREMKKERKDSIERLLSLLEPDDLNFIKVIQTFYKLSEKTWEKILKEANARNNDTGNYHQ